MTKGLIGFGAAAAFFLLAGGSAQADRVVIDLTHPIPTFQASADDPLKPDLGKPYGDSVPIPSFGQQTVRATAKFPTNEGYFELGHVVLAEHHGTHMDTAGHYVNNDESMNEGGIPPGQRPRLHELGGNDLSGPVVLVDISGRVQGELDKNGGKPSPDTSVTDFSDASGNVVTPDDIQAVADQIVDGAWVVLHQGWSRFFFEGTDFGKDPYINGWNFPGLTPAAADKIIEIENAKGVRINGIMSDVIGVETGQNSKGSDDKWSDSWYVHVNGMQRGWKLVENGTNMEQLAQAGPQSCLLVVGAPKWVSGGGGPARVIAVCDN